MNWGVIETWHYVPVEIVKITPRMAFYKDGPRERRCDLSALSGGNLDETTAKLLAERLTSAKAECRRREAAARDWFQNEKRRYVTAAIERAASVDTLPKGRDGEAGSVRSKGSAVREAETPNG